MPLFKITAHVRVPPNRQGPAGSALVEPPYNKMEYLSDNNMVEDHMEMLHGVGLDVLSVTSKPAVPNVDEGNDGNLPSSITE